MSRLLTCCFLVVSFFLTGCNRQDTEALTRIANKIHSRSEVASSAVQANAAASWNVVGEPSLDVRVAGRLRWDKELSGLAIEVVNTANGIELRGQVQTMEQRRRAMMIADTTAGVTSVTDSLTQYE